MSDDTRQIGSFELLTERIYPLDAWAEVAGSGTEVVVQPGSYPIYQQGISHWWMMSGRINRRNGRLGDGMFTLGGPDDPTGPAVTFPSMMFGPDEMRAMMASPEGQPGPAQRYSIRLTEELDR